MAVPTIFAENLPVFLAALVLGVYLALWAIRLPRLSLLLLIISLAVGQTVRVSLPGQGGGLLLSDLASVLVIGAAGLYFFYHRPGAAVNPAYPSPPRPTWSYSLIFTPFLLISLLELLWQYSALGFTSFLVSFSYWLRLAVTLLLLPALLILFESRPLHRFAARLFMAAAAFLAVLGFLQLAFFPDLGFLAPAGWDPHRWRLVSTWLDPNFIGAFFLLAFLFLIGQSKAARLGLAFNQPAPVTAALVFIALLLTQSRSAYLAFAAALLVLSPLLIIGLAGSLGRRQAINLALLFTLLLLLISPAVVLSSRRLLGLFSLDETVRLRAESLRLAWPLAEKHALVGIGYNSYQFIAAREGFNSDFTLHSRAGTDNSALNLWITSGVAGLSAFLVPWLYFMSSFIKAWLKHGRLPALLAAASIFSLFIHSLFVNSLLYSHLLITLIIIIALELRDNSQQSNRGSLPLLEGEVRRG